MEDATAIVREADSQLDAGTMSATCRRERSKIKMETLAQELNDSRLDISTALNSMQKAGLLTLSRGKIFIPHAEKL